MDDNDRRRLRAASHFGKALLDKDFRDALKGQLGFPSMVVALEDDRLSYVFERFARIETSEVCLVVPRRAGTWIVGFQRKEKLDASADVCDVHPDSTVGMLVALIGANPQGIVIQLSPSQQMALVAA